MTPGQARRAQRVYEGLQAVKPGEALLFQKDNGERVLIVVAAVPEETRAAEVVGNVKKLAMRGGPAESHHTGKASEDLLLPTEETQSA